MIDLNIFDFYKGKKVLVTGHTGFKGSWLCSVLALCDAEVTGYALDPDTDPSMFSSADVGNRINSVIGDIRDYDSLSAVFDAVKPEIVFHLAAQPLVRESYKKPVYTYETNVMGTVNICECIRHCDSVKSFLNVTTDKVYKNNEWEWGYRENEPLDGFDPYSNSKSCSELVTHSYKDSFLHNLGVAVSTARAGNVIGGGDFSADRIIPDCIRAAQQGIPIRVRNPLSVRPYQHVLEPLSAYLLIAQRQYEDIRLSGYYNVGPDENSCCTTGELVTLFCDVWGDISWINEAEENALHEANFLKLDCSKIKSVIGWSPMWSIEEALTKTADWTKAFFRNEHMRDVTDNQISEFFALQKGNL